jgi:hypothetical protein
LANLRHVPLIKYYDPVKSGKTLAARLAWKLYQKSDIFDELEKQWPIENREAHFVIIDRSFDVFIPLIHSLCYHAAIQDLLSVENDNRVTVTDDQNETPIILDSQDTYFRQLRHLFIGDAGELIQKFILDNPAVSAHYARSSNPSNPTTSELKDQLYALSDANKVQNFI